MNRAQRRAAARNKKAADPNTVEAWLVTDCEAGEHGHGVLEVEGRECDASDCTCRVVDLAVLTHDPEADETLHFHMQLGEGEALKLMALLQAAVQPVAGRA